jgi:hypothetical protein
LLRADLGYAIRLPQQQEDIMGRTVLCSNCDEPTSNAETEFGDPLCQNCYQNFCERAWERFCSDFHDGGSTRFRSLRDQQIEAMKLK